MTENNIIIRRIWIGIKSVSTGVGQVMFQQSAITGLIFLCGIFWGSYECGTPQVAWGALAGTIAATLAAFPVNTGCSEGRSGLWGFNGTLVGCAFPTFFAPTVFMWCSLVLCAVLSTWVRAGMNNVLGKFHINSLTFPFVLLTWIFLLASRVMDSLIPLNAAAPVSSPDGFSMASLAIYWLKGISQVFLINSWITGILFLIGLAVCSRMAAAWAMAGSAIGIAIAFLFGADASGIENGLFGFSPVLTALAVGCVFNKPGLRSAIWTIFAVITTVFMQAATNAFLSTWELPALTAPFCVTTWMFLLPACISNGKFCK